MGLRIPEDGGLGSDMAGQVEAVGRAVTRFRPGDEVYAFVLAGGFAEYARVPEGVLGPKPANLSFEQAPAVPLAAQGRLILSSGESSGRWVGPMDRIVKAVALSPFVPQTLAPSRPSRAATTSRSSRTASKPASSPR